jgi:hypothetical protein
MLAGGSRESDFGDKIQVFSIPQRLHRDFWKLNLQTLTHQGGVGADLAEEYNRFINVVAGFLSFIEAPLPEHCSFCELKLISSKFQP